MALEVLWAFQLTLYTIYCALLFSRDFHQCSPAICDIPRRTLTLGAHNSSAHYLSMLHVSKWRANYFLSAPISLPDALTSFKTRGYIRSTHRFGHFDFLTREKMQLGVYRKSETAPASVVLTAGAGR
jgi:hypothetical protein